MTGCGSLHSAVDKETGAIRALDLPFRAKIQKYPGMAERSSATIARSDALVDVDGFEWPHMRPGNDGGARPPR